MWPTQNIGPLYFLRIPWVHFIPRDLSYFLFLTLSLSRIGALVGHA
jgi:hypothetical protein